MLSKRSCEDQRRVSRQKGEAGEALVIIVDDDASVREALSELIRSAGLPAELLRLDPGTA